MTRGVLRPSAKFSIFRPGATRKAAIRSEVASRGAGFTMLLWVVVSPGIFIPCAKAAAGNPAARTVAARHGKIRHGKIKCLISEVLLCGGDPLSRSQRRCETERSCGRFAERARRPQ